MKATGTGGDRRIDGSFESIGNWTAWWSSTEYGSDLARGLGIQNYSPFSFITISYKKQALSVRCVFQGIPLNN
jgi:uncharacterized protein (TIGR02145 family)